MVELEQEKMKLQEDIIKLNKNKVCVCVCERRRGPIAKHCSYGDSSLSMEMLPLCS